MDVFSSTPLKGNGLTVVFPEKPITKGKLLKISQEFKQFETIFIFPKEEDCYPVRIFTVEEELDFAGHPILGAAAALHLLNKPNMESCKIALRTGERIVELSSEKRGGYYVASMNQGCASFIKTIFPDNIISILQALGLTENDVHKEFPIESVSTGLPYLLLPVKDLKTLENAKINSNNFEELLKREGAKFLYIFNPETMECRSWDNFGAVEDIATGSAAGPLCAYLVKNGYKCKGEEIIINQGRFVGRSSVITGIVADNDNVIIRGDVSLFAKGEIFD